MAHTQLAAAHKWLIDDQYAHGEWGRCENSDPTAELRSFEISKIKPNLFTSSQAALALQATDYKDPGPTDSFFMWLEKLRDRESGFWTSASGAQVPMGGARGWSEVKNIRHTAKALDLFFLRGCFTSGDAPIFHELIKCQLPDGSFPQHPFGSSELWSTAYAMNLLNRAVHEYHLEKTVPRGKTGAEWSVELRTRNDRARSWICSQVSDSLWRVPGRDPIWISEAVLAEIGADLAIHRPDVASQVATKILREGVTRRGQTLWALLLVLNTLSPQDRSEVEATLAAWSELAIVENTYDMACSVRAFWFKDRPNLVEKLRTRCQGHESLMTNWSPWPVDPVGERPADMSLCTTNVSVDFAILAIRDDEFEAVLKYFGPTQEYVGAQRTYEIAKVTSGSGQQYRVALLRAHEQGHSAAQAAAADVIADLCPSWLLLVGIAGAVPEYEYCLGDVMVASRIVDFSVTAALADGDVEYAARGAPAHKAVQDVAARLPALKRKLNGWNSASHITLDRPNAPIKEDKLIGDQDWRERVRAVLIHHFGPTGVELRRDPEVTSAPIASGNTLMKNPALLQDWLTYARDLKAVEMELPGVYEAARRKEGDIPVLAVRGISDIVGYKRSPEWTAYACNTAASFAHALIYGDVIPPRKD